MAIEAMNMAAVTYHGRTSGAAEHKSRTNEKPAAKTPAAETADRPEENISDSEIRLFEPVREGQQEKKKEFQGGSQQNNKQLQQAIEKFKEKMNHKTEAVFGIHEGTNCVMIKIVDKDTKDILKEYPPEQTLDMIQKVWEMAGIMFDEKF